MRQSRHQLDFPQESLPFHEDDEFWPQDLERYTLVAPFALGLIDTRRPTVANLAYYAKPTLERVPDLAEVVVVGHTLFRRHDEVPDRLAAFPDQP